MISGFIREQERYSQKELCNILKCNEEYVVALIRKLKEFGVIKAVKSSDRQMNIDELSNDSVEISDVEVGESEYLYIFTFVGVIVISGMVLKCYPEYLLNTSSPTKELSQIINVLEKYNSNEQIIRMFNESGTSSTFNLLSGMLFLLKDYFENNLYDNKINVVEYNGICGILWDKTINESFAILSNNSPYYVDFYTCKKVTNDFDYFTRLHKYVLTAIFNELKIQIFSNCLKLAKCTYLMKD